MGFGCGTCGCVDSFSCGICGCDDELEFLWVLVVVLVVVLIVSVVVLVVVMMSWGCGGISVVVITG